MKNTSEHVDLRVLERTSKVEITAPKKRRTGLVVAALIVFGFFAVLFWSLGDLLRKKVTVTVIRPTVAAESGVPEGKVVFQAAGWAEPDPFPAKVGALVSGVVREVLVQESDVVKPGDAVARLVDDEAKLALATADAAWMKAAAEAARADEEAAFVKEAFELALDLEENIATAAAESAGKKAESEKRAETVRRGEAEVKVADEELATQRFLKEEGAAGPRQLELAAAKAESARAALATLKAEAALAEADVQKAEARRARLAREKATRVEDRAKVALAVRQAAVAHAAVEEALALKNQAALALDRTVVRAATGGVVLARMAVPGTVVGPSAEHETICTLWDPAHLRVRVDIPQAEIRRIAIDQSVLVSSEARPNEPYRGKVIRVVQTADIQKVTMQVHVRIEAGDSLIRPEMLVQARFLAPKPESAPADGAKAAARSVIRIPHRLVVGGGIVWTVAPDAMRAKRRLVELGARGGDLVEVVSGINATDKLIDEGKDQVDDGTPVTIRTEN